MKLTDAQRQTFDDALVVDDRRPNMPPLSSIEWAWCLMHGNDEGIDEIFPDLYALAIGWAEPFCFRCGFQPPVRAAYSYPANYKYKRQFASAWAAAAGWLERAHLQDHRHGGGNESLDMVPLCPLCHDSQPICETREQGIEFVRSKSRYDPFLLSLAQWRIGWRYRDSVRPGRSAARRRMHAALAEAGNLIVVNLREEAS